MIDWQRLFTSLMEAETSRQALLVEEQLLDEALPGGSVIELSFGHFLDRALAFERLAECPNVKYLFAALSQIVHVVDVLRASNLRTRDNTFIRNEVRIMVQERARIEAEVQAKLLELCRRNIRLIKSTDEQVRAFVGKILGALGDSEEGLDLLKRTPSEPSAVVRACWIEGVLVSMTRPDHVADPFVVRELNYLLNRGDKEVVARADVIFPAGPESLGQLIRAHVNIPLREIEPTFWRSEFCT